MANSKTTVDKTAVKTNTYTISAWVNVLVGVEISAQSFEDAAEKAKALSQENFVSINGDYIDNKPLKLNCIYVNED